MIQIARIAMLPGKRILADLSAAARLGLIALLLPLHGSAVEPAADDRLDAARALWQQGALTEAAVLLERRRADQPNDTHAQLLLAQVYLDLFQGQRAEQTLRQALALGVPRDRLLLPLLRAELRQGAYLRMLEEAEDARFPDPERQATLEALRGLAWLGRDDLDAARAACERARELIPMHPDALLGLARVARRGGATNAATALLDTLTRAHPQYAPGWELLAQLRYLRGDLAGADEALGIAQTVARNKGQPRLKRALVRIEQGDIDAAATDIETTAQELPDFPALHFARGALLLAQGLAQRGIESIQEYLRYAPDDLQAILVLARAELRRGNLVDGERYLRRYLHSLPASVEGNLRLARLLLAKGELDAAERRLLTLVEAGTAPAMALALLADIAQARSRPRDKLHWLRRAAAEAPGNADYRVRLASALMSAGDSAGALETVRAALALAPTNRSAALLEVKILLALPDARQALERAESLAALRRGDPDVLNALGLARLALRDPEGARQALAQALAADPGHEDAALNQFGLLLRSGDPAAARAILRAFLTAAPDAPAAVVLALAALDARESGEQARQRRLEAAVDARPEQLALRLALARSYLTAGQPKRGRTLLQSAPEPLRRAPALLALVAASQIASGEPDTALETIDALRQQAPNIATAPLLSAQAHAAAGRRGEAESALAQALASDPDPQQAAAALDGLLAGEPSAPEQLALLDRLTEQAGEARLLRERKAEVLTRLGAHRQALLLLHAIQREAPGEAGPTHRLAQAQHAAGDPTAARRLLRGWLDAHPRDHAARLMLAQLEAEQGRTDRAVEMLGMLVEERPGDVVALNNLAWLLREQDPERALRYAERANRLAPNVAALMDTLGTLLVHAGQLERGLRLLDDARIADPTEPVSALHYAEALVVADRLQEARVVLLGLIGQRFPEQDHARALLERLDD